MTGDSERLTPEEARRRASERKRIQKLATRYGFRTVAGRPGCFYHPDIDQAVVFDWSEAPGLLNVEDLIVNAYCQGVTQGRAFQRNKMREALGV